MAPNTEYLEVAHQRAVEKKTHVSFPQLKYPSLRDEGVRDPVQWLTGKAMDDGAEGLWRVYNGLYDLTDFLNRHPGGAEWLELSKGTDITEAFECHHLSPTVYKMLEKFYVRDAKTPRNSPFTFKEDGFYKTLKREVVEELKKVPKHIPKYADMIIDGLFITLLTSSVLACIFEKYWLKMASYIIASFSLAWVTVASHNYIHRRSNWRMYLFNFSLWSYRDFRVSHALSHHLYPNTLMDLEVSAFEPLVYWNPRKNVPFFSKFAFLIELAFFPFAFMKNFIVRVASNFFRKDFFKNHFRWHDVIGLTLPVWMWFISGVPFSEAFVMWLWINCTASFIFFTIGSNAAHHHPKIFKDGDQVRDPNPDWGMHELEAVMDRTDINGNLFKVMTFFGDHALHHLFPTLDHAVLPYLYPVFLKNCEKFRANFRMNSSLDLFIGQIKQTLKTDPNLLEDN
ncbi:fatty acid desaturase domain-containing protein [Phthorimaea operculella]|nr:fatty acid desaturase domain-containing protein [Phthorimaea operculella]